jgi:S-DNA-T family DNA segregation ATPase FtsK/SpoIIIE
VVVDVEPDHTVAEMAAAVGRQVGAAEIGDGAIYVARLDARLPGTTTMAAAGLAQGDVIRLDGRVADDGRFRRSDRTVACDLLGGPMAGCSTSLHPGRYVIGRAASCDIVVDDPSMAPRHAMVTVADDWSVGVSPLPSDGPAGGTCAPVVVGLHPLDGEIPVDADDVVTLGGTKLAFRQQHHRASHDHVSDGQIPFQRTPYRPVVVADRDPHRLRGVPRTLEPRRLQFVAVLAPLAAGLVLYAFSRQVQFLALTLVSPVAMVANALDDRRSGRRSHRHQVEVFRDGLAASRVEIERARSEELRERGRAAPDLAALARRAAHRTIDLWERDAEARNFLHLRLGTGTVPASRRVEVDGDGDESLRAEAVASASGLDAIDGAPITVDVAGAGVVALHGPGALVDGLVAGLLMQAACLHGPDDLALVAAVGPDRPLEWLKWLPHVRSATSPMPGAHVVHRPDAGSRLVTALLDVIAQRAAADVAWPRLLVVVDAELGLDGAAVARLLDDGPAAGVFVLVLAPAARRVPHQAQTVVSLAYDGGEPTACVWSTDPEVPTDERVAVELVHPSVAERTALALAPVRDTSTASVATSVPRMAELLEVIGHEAADPLAVAARWRSARPHGLAFDLGAGANGPQRFDLVHDGPHALVAGTSGAGKSELLQAMVASLAAAHPPERLTFLFVDYKGGAASNVFAALPHTVGYVTNLGAGLAMRALTSLRAELNHRMTLLEGRAKDLEEMREVAPGEAPPSLVIVVDEFATLVKEIPDFVAGIVDIAQRGRSLGIHLVLATQRPTGAVDDNILANTNLRICLRMLDRSESTSMLGVPDAADIPVPLRGRALARLGGKVVPFQCAYGGAPVRAGHVRRAVLVGDFRGVDDAPRPAAVSTEGGRDAGSPPAPVAQLDAVVAAIAAAGRLAATPTLRRPWCEALPDTVVLDRLLADPRCAPARRHPGRWVPVGLLDAPERQEQHPLLVDLEDGGGCLVFGSGGAGKTTLLRTIAAAVQHTSTLGDVAVLAFDFASRGLMSLRPLPCVLDVVAMGDTEAITRHVAVLEREVARRGALLGAADAEHLSAFADGPGGHERLPRIVVLIDGFGNVSDAFGGTSGPLSTATDHWVDRLVRLVVDGRRVGIHAVITADRRNAVPSRLHAAIANRLVLRQADDGGYVDHGIPPAVAGSVDLVPGRALWRSSSMVQIASAASDAGAREQGAAIAALAALHGERPHHPAIASSALPDVVAWSRVGGRPGAVGIEDVAGVVVTFDVATSHALVLGGARAGRSTALAAVGEAYAGRCEVHRLGAIGSGLARWAGGAGAFGAEQVRSVLQRLDNLLAIGRPLRPILLLVDDADGLDDPGLAPLWDRVLGNDDVRVVASADVRSITGFSADPLLTRLKRVRRMLVLRPDDPSEFLQLTGLRLPHRPGLVWVAGRGVAVVDGEAAVVQVAFPGPPPTPSPGSTVSGSPAERIDRRLMPLGG